MNNPSSQGEVALQAVHSVRTPSAVGTSDVLLVSVHPAPRGLAWAKRLPDAFQAIAYWRLRKPRIVCADFGAIGAGMTGARLAKALRKEALALDAGQSVKPAEKTEIYLLVDDLQDQHWHWGRMNGADDVVERGSSFFELISPSIDQSQPHGGDFGEVVTEPMGLDGPFVSSMPPRWSEAHPDKVGKRVIKRLQEHGRVGPAAALIVRQVLHEMALQGGVSSLDELSVCIKVAYQIPSEAGKEAFLASLADLTAALGLRDMP